LTEDRRYALKNSDVPEYLIHLCEDTRHTTIKIGNMAVVTLFRTLVNNPLTAPSVNDSDRLNRECVWNVPNPTRTNLVRQFDMGKLSMVRESQRVVASSGMSTFQYTERPEVQCYGVLEYLCSAK
jgi:hypothetical protein